jgi:hypothetical protein
MNLDGVREMQNKKTCEENYDPSVFVTYAHLSNQFPVNDLRLFKILSVYQTKLVHSVILVNGKAKTNRLWN